MKIIAIYFSPVDHTRKLTQMVSGKMSELLDCPCININVTSPDERKKIRNFESDDLLILGSPTYRGKLPALISDDFANTLFGKETPVVEIVTFGNRNFDNSLAEMNAILKKGGFRPAAAAAFCTEHEYTPVLGTGRPDMQDFLEAENFAKTAVSYVADALYMKADLRVPGKEDAAYFVPVGINGNIVNFQSAKPRTDMVKCVHCGICVKVCPLGSIDRENVDSVPGPCLKCQACIKKCPVHAKTFDDPALLDHIAQLERDFSQRKESSFFYINQ